MPRKVYLDKTKAFLDAHGYNDKKISDQNPREDETESDAEPMQKQSTETANELPNAQGQADDSLLFQNIDRKKLANLIQQKSDRKKFSKRHKH